MELKKGYKNTEIGVIPEDWEVQELCELGNFKNGINKSAEDFGYGTPLVNLMDVFGKVSIGKLDKFDLVNANKYERELYNLKNGDVLFIRSSVKPSGVGLTTVIGEDLENFVFSGFLIRYRTNNVDNDFKKYCFDSEYFRNSLIANSTVSANTNINQEALKKLILTFPKSKIEQQKIAEALSDTDALIQSLKKLIAKKKDIKQGAMQELLTPKEDWEEWKLGEIAHIKMGQSPLSAYYNDKGEGYPLIQGNADLKERKTIIRNFTTSLTKKGESGDIILTVRAPVGAVAKATFDCCLGRGVCSIRYENDYLYHYFIFIESLWEKLSTGSTFDSINSDQLSKIKVPFPKSKAEQTFIAQILSDMDAEIESLEKQLQKTELLKQGMMQELLTGRIRLIKPQAEKLEMVAEPKQNYKTH